MKMAVIGINRRKSLDYKEIQEGFFMWLFLLIYEVVFYMLKLQKLIQAGVLMAYEFVKHCSN